MTDSRVRKTLASINTALDLQSNFYTFQCSGATLAYKAHVPIKSNQRAWHLDVGLWRYIQFDVDKDFKVANGKNAAMKL